jgi:hypothetical protein
MDAAKPAKSPITPPPTPINTASLPSPALFAADSIVSTACQFLFSSPLFKMQTGMFSLPRIFSAILTVFSSAIKNVFNELQFDRRFNSAIILFIQGTSFSIKTFVFNSLYEKT